MVLLKMVDLNGEELGLISYSVYLFIFKIRLDTFLYITEREKRDQNSGSRGYE